MENIFEILIQIMMAYFQIIMLFFGIIFFCIGVGIFMSAIKKNKKHRHWFTATICAIREGEGMADENGAKSKQYYPVFEGVGLDGRMQQYECQTASTDINHYKVGTRFEVTLDGEKDKFVSLKEDDKTDIIVGIVLFLIGGFMIIPAILFIKFTQFTFVVWALTAIVGVVKFSKYIKPKHLRETIAQFKQRRNIERLVEHQSKPTVSQDYIQQTNIKFDAIRSGMNKFTLFMGFVILSLGGMGYNSQLQFIENSNLEYTGPCGLELGEDCRRPILYQDILSMLPIQLRPAMEGIYVSKYDSSRMLVSYGRWTAAPYLILMGLGALVILGAIRSNGGRKKTI